MSKNTLNIFENLLLQNQPANFNQTWYKLSFGHGNSKLFKLRAGSLQRGDNHKNGQMGWGHLKIFFSKTTGPILTRLGTNHPWVKGIQVCSKEGDSPSPKGR